MDYSHYKFVEMEVEFLDELAPADTPWGFDINGERKLMIDFILNYHLSDTGLVLFKLAAKAEPEYTFRSNSVSDMDLNDWDNFLGTYGVTRDQWLDVDEYEALLVSGGYA